MIEQFLIGAMRNFTYLISDREEAVVVDPQANLGPWEDRLQESGTRLVAVLLTHTHHDHVAGVQDVVRKYGVPVCLNVRDAFRLENWDQDIRGRFRYVEDDDVIMVGSLRIQAMHTPGHSKGEVCYLLADDDGHHLFTGDTIFVGDVGRTDLEGGSNEELFATLQRIKQLRPETVLYPGHHYGSTPTTTLARELRESPAFKCTSIAELAAIP
jgi:glyoxylase-like metal-dependent hydrolase (beta-lactamase superfamily II)